MQRHCFEGRRDRDRGASIPGRSTRTGQAILAEGRNLRKRAHQGSRFLDSYRVSIRTSCNGCSRVHLNASIVLTVCSPTWQYLTRFYPLLCTIRLHVKKVNAVCYENLTKMSRTCRRLRAIAKKRWNKSNGCKGELNSGSMKKCA